MTFGVALKDGSDPVLGKMVLQEGRVEVAAAVLVADGEDWGLGARGWGLGDSRVYDFAQQADRHMRQRGGFVSIVGDELVELAGEHETCSDQQWPNAGPVARAGEARF